MPLTRRSMLALTGVAASGWAVSGWAALQPRGIWFLRDGSLAEAELNPAIRSWRALELATMTVLQADLVRQWRAGLREAVLRQDGEVVALVRWDKALVLQGLLREERKASSIRRVSAPLFEVRCKVGAEQF